MNVLVAYASVHGSTRTIADAIAARLREHGLETDCCAVNDACRPAEYDAVVIGSALHNRRWLPMAAHFVSDHGSALQDRRIWLFSVGMPSALPRRWQRAAAQEGPTALAALRPTIKAEGTHLFSGEIRPHHLPLQSRLFMRALHIHFGDYRDWDEINRWADEIAAHLGNAVVAERTPSGSSPTSVPRP